MKNESKQFIRAGVKFSNSTAMSFDVKCITQGLDLDSIRQINGIFDS